MLVDKFFNLPTQAVSETIEHFVTSATAAADDDDSIQHKRNGVLPLKKRLSINRNSKTKRISTHDRTSIRTEVKGEIISGHDVSLYRPNSR